MTDNYDVSPEWRRANRRKHFFWAAVFIVFWCGMMWLLGRSNEDGRDQMIRERLEFEQECREQNRRILRSADGDIYCME